MDMREAFDKWLQGRVFTLEAKSPGEWMLIGATWACEWQKQKDAEIAVFMKFDEQKEWVNDCGKTINQYLEVVKKEILNQGKQNG